ncbi:hypothetical protein FCULG_00000034 [Fusarium culmorum]|uniref:Heterokaryon incompatibility domain-containing protein n=1 Tax=Fusarium culmorum TaxID=5516 RepID=A0A2T4GKT1_FUSCU|nr:hypothetical protein FCULG_00000034 [Fusarium culmorum]
MAELLCSDCLLFEESLQNYSSKYSHRTLKWNIESLKESAQQGCSLCRVIYQSFIYDEGALLQDAEAPIEISTKDSSRYNSEVPTKARLYPSCSTADLKNKLLKHKRDLLAILKIRHLTKVSKNSQCGHRVFSVDIYVVPTRLIDVGTENSSQPPRLCLPRKDQSCGNIEYAALSYAWGLVNNSHSSRTTASNLEEMLRGLPFSQLPKTIQDAIVFTRKLGFRYLWVDALRILQSEGPHDASHQQDWSHEATRFGYYYQNAAITIAATGARSLDDGLFLPRPALAFDPNPVILRRKRPTGETRDISILPNVPSWISEIKKAPLYEGG